MTEIISISKARIGVFLCQCGQKIESKIDLNALQEMVRQNKLITYTAIESFPCSAPGFEAIKTAIIEHNLDRLIIAGCEARVILKKFEQQFVELGLDQGQIDIVNLRGHVAQVHEDDPGKLAEKGAKLIAASAAFLDTLRPSPKVKIDFNGPVMIIGGGIGSYSAAQELSRRQIETIVDVYTEDVDDEIRMLHEHYPGERSQHDRLRKIITEVHESPYVRLLTQGQLEKVMGRVGDYSVVLSGEDNKPPRQFQVGAIIAALDGQMLNQGSDFGHDGVKVICHTEMEERLWVHGAPNCRVVFWINDPESGRPWEYLSVRAAWNMACFIKENTFQAEVCIFYNEEMNVPLTADQRIKARELDIDWIPYNGGIRPTVQNGYVTYNNSDDQIERELPWDMLVISPLRSPGIESLKIAEILGLDIADGEFLERNPQMVRPEQVGQDEKFVVGSARRPCDLRDALRQGRRAAAKVAQIVEQAEAGELYAPRMVCTVDSSKCIGCGLCREICDCGGIEPVDGFGGNVPREVDPMVCTGGGTCAAACPYHALDLQNNTTKQREARVASLVQSMAENEVLGFGCNWGGSAAADHAGLQGLKYDSRFYLLSFGCIGQLDPAIMGRAFLEGANGLLLVGCPPEECHHSYGLDHAWGRVNLMKKLLDCCGIERERIALAHSDMNKPEQFIRSVESFLATIDDLGPIKRDKMLTGKIRSLYNTLLNSRVRWVHGASLRRPYESTYPADQRNALAFDVTMSDVVAEEFVRSRVISLLQESKEVWQLESIANTLEEENKRIIGCLRDLSSEGLISRIFKDRVPYYTMM
ncbi:MAG: hydrogenase iron-sulfur subunit [Deltaproteobacteria bacterium]|nr:hydrogenase iron-sulfur subunit [Deltaproteobacteria bacterium]